MEPTRTSAEIRSAFRALAAADRARAALHPLEHYQRLFAGSESIVAEEYAALPAGSHAPTVVSGAPPAPRGNLGRIGPYLLVAELGAGGMGRVYRAVCERKAPGLREGQEVALKVVHSHLTESEGFFKRFLREAEFGKRVSHPNVVRTLDIDAGTMDGRTVHYLVMEFVEGRTLRSMYGEMGRMPEALCLHIAREAGKGLAAIHATGVVHRDFKPENVLVTREHAVRVMDLGVARLVDEAVRLSATGAFVGTVPYAAPEQFLGGGKEIDGRADLYALGLTLYELATGVHPFLDEDAMAMLRRRLSEDPRPPSVHNPQISPFFEEVVKTLVAREPGQRFASAAELVAVLDQGETSPWWRRRSGEIRGATKRPLRRIRIPRDTALFGRSAEIARLRSLWGRARDGEGQVLLVEGEAGIGKSRLVDEFAALLHREGEELNFLYGSHPPGGAATATGALAAACREQFGTEDLDATVASCLSAAPLLAPAFASLLREEPPPRGVEPLTKEALHAAFAHVLRSLGKERPTLVLVDDLHFAPEEGRALFAALAMAVRGSRVLLVGTSRPGLPEDWITGLERAASVGRMPVGRLGPRDLHGLLVEAFGSERLAEELGGRIGAKSDGNPFFVFEILRSLREGGALRRGADGTWAKTSEIREIEIPSTVADLIRARIGRLEEADRNLLDVAACCGFEFDPLLVGEAAGLGRIPVLQRLAGIEKAHRLVRSSGRKFVFDHHQVQEVIHAALPELLREEYHAVLGEALERREGAATKEPKDLPGALALELCRHFLEGGRGASADRYLDAALDHLDREFLAAEAVALAERAIERANFPQARRIALRLRQVAWLERLGRVAEWRAVMDDAFALGAAAEDPATRVRVRLARARLLNHVAEHGTERALLDEALTAANALGDRRLEAETWQTLARHYHSQTRFSKALECQRRVAALAAELGDRDMEVHASVGIGAELSNLGHKLESIPCYEPALAHARERGQRRLEQGILTNLSISLNVLGRHEEALAHSRRSLEIACGTGDANGEIYALAAVAFSQWNLGELADALAFRERQLDKARAVGKRFMESSSLLNLGATFVDLGGIDRAEALLDEASRIAREAGMTQNLLFIAQHRARVEEARGDAAAAELLYREALSLATPEDYARRGFWVHRSLGAILLSRGEHDEARLCYERSLQGARTVESPDEVVFALASLATLPGGDSAAAEEAFRALPRKFPPSTTMHLRYALWTATRDPSHLAEAHRLLLWLHDRLPPEYREGFMARVPLHRDIVAAWNSRGG